MSRIAKVPVEKWDPELRTRFRADEATEIERGVMRMFAHRPETAKGILDMRAGMARDRTLSPRLLELVRLRIAFHNQCRSCMAIRYRGAQEDGVTEDLVCSLEKPYDAPDLTDAEKAALAYADRFATDHLSLDDAAFNALRQHFAEGQLVELAIWVAYCVGFGRLNAALDMTEDLPEAFHDKSQPVAPWAGLGATAVR